MDSQHNRRLEVERPYYHGETVTAMAKELGVHRHTISSDLDALQLEASRPSAIMTWTRLLQRRSSQDTGPSAPVHWMDAFPRVGFACRVTAVERAGGG